MNDLHIKPREWEEDDLSILAIVVFCLVLCLPVVIACAICKVIKC